VSGFSRTVTHMAGTRCVHGIDSRFCAVCNRTSRTSRAAGAIGSVTLAEIQEFLKAEQVRATARAIAEVLGVDLRSLTTQLGADAAQDGSAPSISSGTELLMRMTAWKAKREKP
jgi:hypothetical protein